MKEKRVSRGNFLESLWLFTPLVKSEAHGQTVWDNVLAKRWWALGKKSVYVYVY